MILISAGTSTQSERLQQGAVFGILNYNDLVERRKTILSHLKVEGRVCVCVLCFTAMSGHIGQGANTLSNTSAPPYGRCCSDS